ncbi:MAG: tRNA lysidine(34) synthetase TilS [Bacteroidales bacterium]|nr:tRNA lysidine(34) synthetase TilS [Bacteroidales bacterium]
MNAELQKFIDSEALFTKDDRLILAVSGGLDSMCMLHLFQQTDYRFVAAHCNFHLRGAESDADETFVRDYCRQLNIPLYVEHFATKQYAARRKVSIEMAARDLRYEWFDGLRRELGYTRVATAHHQDDVAETVLLNLCRGSGLHGVCGIMPRNGYIVRPILFTTRPRLTEYATRHNIPFRHDSSNDNILFQRNLIRHKVIPLLRKINPAVSDNIARTASILREVDAMLNRQIRQISEEAITRLPNGDVHVDIDSLINLEYIDVAMYELLHPFGFNALQINNIRNSLDSISGKMFFSARYRLVKDRKCLIISKIPDGQQEKYTINDNSSRLLTPFIRLDFQKIIRDDTYTFCKTPDVADFDCDRLEFPLSLRHWREGDVFRPLGMLCFKKLSDFFVNEKLSLPEKEACWLLCSGNDIVWIAGYRIDDRFKITVETKNILRVKISPRK